MRGGRAIAHAMPVTHNRASQRADRRTCPPHWHDRSERGMSRRPPGPLGMRGRSAPDWNPWIANGWHRRWSEDLALPRCAAKTSRAAPTSKSFPGWLQLTSCARSIVVVQNIWLPKESTRSALMRLPTGWKRQPMPAWASARSTADRQATSFNSSSIPRSASSLPAWPCPHAKLRRWMSRRHRELSAACADVSGAGPSPAAELRSAYSFGIIALAARRTPRFRLRAPTRVMAVGRDGEAGRRTTISSPTPMVPGLLTVA